MTHSNKIIDLLSEFQRFDKGEQTPVYTFSDMSDVSPGDLIPWECAQFGGFAKVVSIRPFDDYTELTLLKIS